MKSMTRRGLILLLALAAGACSTSSVTARRGSHLEQIVLPPELKPGADAEMVCLYVAEKRSIYCITTDEWRVRQHVADSDEQGQ
jgi:hypothetical protein